MTMIRLCECPFPVKILEVGDETVCDECAGK